MGGIERRTNSILFAGLAIASLASLADADGRDRADHLAPSVTFSRQIVRIFQSSCQRCHRPGQGAPMSLMTYAEVRPWAKAIKAAVTNKKMPPWAADPAIGEYVDDPSLTDDQIAMIARWVDAGAPEGDSAKLPPPLQFPQAWAIAEPDLVLQMDEEFIVPADGPDLFEHFVIPTGMIEDRFVRAVQILPGNAKVVHHVLVFVHQADDYDFGEEMAFGGRLGRGGSLLTEYAIGNQGDVFPAGTGRLLRAGAELRLEMHYHPYGEAAQDRTQIGLVFYPRESQPQRVLTRAIGKFRLHLPPNTDNIRTEASYTFRRSVRILSFQPHMHGRGKSMTFEAIYPDGSARVLGSFPRYDFNWQLNYSFKDPLVLPAGTQLNVTGIHDNTTDNPNNPDPTAHIYFGRNADDEMMHGWTDFVYAD